jgi:hypothetical protein
MLHYSENLSASNDLRRESGNFFLFCRLTSQMGFVSNKVALQQVSLFIIFRDHFKIPVRL